MRRLKNCAAMALGAGLLLSSLAQAQERRQSARAKLVVVLVVDQMRADYVDRYGHQWTRGLRRLMDHGAWFRQAAYPYFYTFTCAGHATISTGSIPATHGIVANTWYDRQTGKRVACTDDAQAPAVGYGAPAKGSYSAARLAVPTFADELRAQSGAPARVITFSIKARSAIMLAGHRADAATWFDSAVGAWETSTAYATVPVPFVEGFVKAHPVDRDLGKSWTRALPAQEYLYEDEAPGEKKSPNGSSAFPHPLQGKSGKPDAEFYGAWEASPFSDVYLVELAKAAVDVEHLGQGRGTDFLGVSFSALDLVGHAYGPRSHEVQDVLVRLDEALGRFFEHLDRTVGPGNYVVAFTSDHGVAPVPEQMLAEGMDAGRVSMEEVAERVEKALESLPGPSLKVVRYSAGDIYFAPGVYAQLAAEPGRMRAVTEAILSVRGVARVLRSEDLAARRATTDLVERAASLSYFVGRSGDLTVVPKPYWFFAEEAYATGTTHSTPYGYDARVPIFLMGRGIRPGEYLTAAMPADIAPTLAFLFGITLAPRDGRVLVEALVVEAARPVKAPAQKR